MLGASFEIGRILAQTHPDAVLITIPDAPRERLEAVVGACDACGIPCRSSAASSTSTRTSSSAPPSGEG